MFSFTALIIITSLLAVASEDSWSWTPLSWLERDRKEMVEEGYQADWIEPEYSTYEALNREMQKLLVHYQVRIAVLEQQLNASNERILAESKAHETSRKSCVDQAKSQAQINELKFQLAERDLADCRTQNSKPRNKTIPSSVARTFEHLGHKLALSTKLATWSEAASTCHQYGWSLLSVEDQHKQLAVMQIRILAGETGRWQWMSGNSLTSKGSHVWQSSGRPFCFTNWAQGKPEKEEELRCVYTKGDAAQWFSGICYGTAYFICEDKV